jgi:hypothetical protein
VAAHVAGDTTINGPNYTTSRDVTIAHKAGNDRMGGSLHDAAPIAIESNNHA